MSDRIRHMRRKIMLGALVILVAMVTWTFSMMWPAS